MAHGVVTHTLSAADNIQTGIQNSAKVVANVSAGLLQEGQNGVMEVVDTLKEVLGEVMILIFVYFHMNF